MKKDLIGEVSLPSPDLQIRFADILMRAEEVFLQQALLASVAELKLFELDRELHTIVPPAALARLAGSGLRGELVFPVPLVLNANPRLLGYYRLVYGFSQKEFYLAKYGTGIFKSAEESGVLSARALDQVAALCLAYGKCGAQLVEGLPVLKTSPALFEKLSLLTLGAQLRGSANVARGNAAIGIVFEIIERLTRDSIVERSVTRMEICNAAKRRVIVAFASDPDIAISEEISPTVLTQKIAIEVKGGTDFSNIHNRVGEAEKSHQKAKQAGFEQFWTIVNVTGFDEMKARQASPTTNRFYNLAELRDEKSSAFMDFRDRLISLLGLRSKSRKK
jgi:hypothetical protein